MNILHPLRLSTITHFIDICVLVHFEEFIKSLEHQLAQPLPGKEAQSMLRPYSPLSPSLDPPALLTPKESAVMALIYPIDNKAHLLLTERPIYRGAHSGQISFPGGKLEKNETALEAALRETKEEVGVDAEWIKVLGNLSQLYVWASNFNVNPYVGYLNEKPNFLPDPREVATILEAPLEMFFKPGVVKEKPLKNALGFGLNAPYFDVFDRTLWGATAMIISELIHIIDKSEQDYYKIAADIKSPLR